MTSSLSGSAECTVSYGKMPIEEGDRTIKSVITAGQQKGLFAQLLTSRVVVSPLHCAAGYTHSKTAMETRTAFSRSLEMEFLLRLTASRQLEKTLKWLSLPPGQQEVVLFLAGGTENTRGSFLSFLSKKLGFTPHPPSPPDTAFLGRVFNLSPEKVRAFPGNTETEQWENAILEQMALCPFL